MLADIERRIKLAGQIHGDLPLKPKALNSLRPVYLENMEKANSSSVRIHYCGNAVIELTQRMILFFDNNENLMFLTAGLPRMIFAVPVAYVSSVCLLYDRAIVN